jgi:phosphoribosylformylglycinamidine synthase PurS subunit
MAQYNVAIEIMPHKELLDPQGKAVTSGLKGLGLQGVENVRVGKHIRFEVSAASSEEATQVAETACKNLLVNPIMEAYAIHVSLA